MSAEARNLIGWLSRVERRRLVRVGDLRPEFASTVPDVDRLGREEKGHWLGGLTYARLVAEWGVGVREVPSDFWALDVTDDGFPCAMIACPCGSTPSTETLGPILACEGDGCGRYFFFDGQAVWVFNSPTQPTAPTD